MMLALPTPTMQVVFCTQDHPWPEDDDKSAADYLRRLAERIERGEIRHVSLSVHPK